MDIGIQGRMALVCASSQGLGFACASALAAEGAEVVLNGRSAERLAEAASKLRANVEGAKVHEVVADLNTQEGQAALIGACPEPDILVTNNAGPIPRNFSDLDRERWMATLETHLVAPMMLVQAVLPAMKRRRFGRIINITSAMVTAPKSHMVISAGPRAGLTAVMKGLSVEVAQYNITINNLLPERIDTDRQIFMANATAERENITFEEARERQVKSIPARRLGEPREFGAMCAFLSGNLAGFITGQNLHLDGGAYPALI
jgi:3-oxoacyl-[acyl-carrier protein] reductase